MSLLSSNLLIPNFFNGIATPSATICFKRFMENKKLDAIVSNAISELFLEAEGIKEINNQNKNIIKLSPEDLRLTFSIAHDLAIKNNRIEQALFYERKIKRIEEKYHLKKNNIEHTAVPSEKKVSHSESNVKENTTYESDDSEQVDNQEDNTSAGTDVEHKCFLQKPHKFKAKTPKKFSILATVAKVIFAGLILGIMTKAIIDRTFPPTIDQNLLKSFDNTSIAEITGFAPGEPSKTNDGSDAITSLCTSLFETEDSLLKAVVNKGMDMDSVLDCTSPSLLNNKELILKVREIEYKRSYLLNQIKYAYKVGGIDGYPLNKADPIFLKDKGIVLAAVKKNGYTLKYASPELKNDLEVVLAAIHEHPYALQYASANLRANKEVVRVVFQSDFPEAIIYYAADELKFDTEYLEWQNIVSAGICRSGAVIRS